MRKFRRIVAIAIFSLILSIQAHPATQGEGELNRADPCTLAPSPQGHANGIEKRCELGGSAGVARGDFNGDGIADLAIGVPGETRSTLGRCSFNFTCTTIDHDDAGAVNILYGSPIGLVRPNSGAAVLAGGPIQDDGHFGKALAAGNFRGNATSDLAVAAPGAISSSSGRRVGSISVFFSSPTGAGLSVNTSQIFFADQFSGAGTVLGNVPLAFPDNMSMTWGDFNGDGVGDLAAEVIVSGATNSTSAVLVLYGMAGTGLSTSKFNVLTVDDGLSPNNFTIHPSCAPNGSHLCFVSRGHVLVSSADLDGDGKTDLLIGAPNASQIRDNGTNAANGFEGVVAIVPGKSPVLDVFFGWSVLRAVKDVDEAGGFGLALAVGDFDADGKKDVAVGAPNNFAAAVPRHAGIVRVFPGVQLFGGQNEAAILSTTFTQDSVETAEENDRFGAALAAKNFNGDGADDLAIGAPGESAGSFTGNGEVNIIFGLAGTGLSTTSSSGHPAAQKITGSNTNAALGSSLSAWNFGVSAEADLAIGAPFHNLQFVDPATGTVPVIAGAGAVFVLFGASQAVSSTGFQSAQIWVQQPPGITFSGFFTTADVASAGNHFGASIY